MQKKKWVRAGLAAVIAGGMLGGMSLAGCSGDDSGTTPPKADGGADSSIPKGDSSTGGDSSQASDTGSSSTDSSSQEASTNDYALVYLVNAASDVNSPPLRFCFGLATAADGGGGVTVAGGIAPFPDFVTIPGAPYAGLYPGFGGSSKGSAQLSQFNLASLNVSLYAIDATQINNDTADGGPDGGKEIPCEGLIGADAQGKGGGKGTLTIGTQYWYLGTVPSGTLVNGSSFVAAAVGCAPGGTGTGCPSTPPYSATTGNYSLRSFPLDNKTAIGATGIGAQFINASSAWDYLGANAFGAASTAAGTWYLSLPSTDGGAAESGASEAGVGDASAEAAVDSGAPAEAGPPVPTLNLNPITGTGVFGTISPATAATAPVPLNSPQGGGFFAAYIAADGGAILAPSPACEPGVSCFSPLLLPLPVIDALSNPVVPDGGNFAYGKAYAFILIGDPQQPQFLNPLDGGPATSTDGVFNGKSLHMLGLPSAN